MVMRKKESRHQKTLLSTSSTQNDSLSIEDIHTNK